MKTFQIKFPVILLIVSLFTVLSLYNCGQGDSNKKTDANTEPVKTETPAITADTQTSVSVNPVKTENADKTKQEVKTDPKKEITSADKKKEQEPVKKTTVEQPVVADKKPVTNTNVTPATDKTVIQPKDKPVVKETEPVKTETAPKTADVKKPDTTVSPKPEQGSWIVPAKYKSMTNPFAVDDESIKLGKSLYATHCKSCHGSNGDGNGPKAAQLDTKIKSFLSGEFLTEKPGEVFYKTTFGRGDMPKFEKKIPDEEERWAIVHYIMSLKK